MKGNIVYDDGVYKITENRWDFHNAHETYYTLEGGDLETFISCDSVEEAKDLMEMIDEGIVIPGKMVHLARIDLGNVVTLEPKYTNRDVYMSGPTGVSFSSSARSAARALPEDFKDYDKPVEYVAYTPTERKKAVFDPEGTGDVEFRVAEPIEVKKVGLISLIVHPGEPMKLKWLEKEE